MSDTPGDNIANLAAFIPEYAERTPDKTAVLFPESNDGEGNITYSRLTYRELNDQIDAFARGFLKIGVTPGMRVSYMVSPCLEFLPLVFALFKIGAVPVLIDPGIGKEKMLSCVELSAPEAFVGVARAQAAKLLYRKYFKSVKIKVTIGSSFVWGGNNLNDIDVRDGPIPAIATRPDDPAAIVFTSGSTGPPKGVVYTHGMFCRQRELLQTAYELTEDDIDMPAFMLFSLYTLSMGCTVVFPDMDYTSPIDVEPKNIASLVREHKPTISFGSPALWAVVSYWCQQNKVRFDSLKKVFMAGAPVPAYLHVRMLGSVLPEDGDIYTPYGATECLPVTSFRGTLMLEETCELTSRGRGFCVGEPLPGVDIEIIAVSDDPIPYWSYAEVLPPGRIGEIVVKGANVSPAYFRTPHHDEAHKIYETEDIDGPFWHRIGDLGYFDKRGRLWLLGRRSQRIEIEGRVQYISLPPSRPIRVEIPGRRLYTLGCEAVFNEHPDVYRCALVGVGPSRYNQLPVLVVEPTGEELPPPDKQKILRNALLKVAEKHDATRMIQTILFNEELPVDVRHNAKINRERLAQWALEMLSQ